MSTEKEFTLVLTLSMFISSEDVLIIPCQGAVLKAMEGRTYRITEFKQPKYRYYDNGDITTTPGEIKGVEIIADA